MSNCAPTKKQVVKGIISIFMHAIPVALRSALFARKSAIVDMIWLILLIETFTVIVEKEEMNHARYGNKGCRVFKREVQT